MKTKKGLTLIEILIIVVILGILVAIVPRLIQEKNTKPEPPITYKGFVIRVPDDSTLCQRHLIIEDRNTKPSQGLMVFIFACDFRRNTDPNDIYFQIINTRNVPKGHPLLKLATLEEIEKIYRHFRAEQAQRKKEKANPANPTTDPRKLTNDPIP